MVRFTAAFTLLALGVTEAQAQSMGMASKVTKTRAPITVTAPVRSPVTPPTPAPVPAPTPAPTSAPTRICKDDSTINEAAAMIASTVLVDANGLVSGLMQYAKDGITIGSITDLIPEASDAAVSGAPVVDGKSGDIAFPFGNLKPIATVGERSVCPESMGEKVVGTPDGLGAYLANDETVRVVVQSESYGPLRFESYKYPVNMGKATFTGSHVQYVDYDRSMMREFMSGSKPASEMVVGMGELIETVYNLDGDLVGKRNGTDSTASGAHYGNTDASGRYTVEKYPTEADWFMQSLCSAHMEEKHQWGTGIGLEDDLFITNEEWIQWQEGKDFVGIGAHAIDVHTKTAYALGVFTQGGFEKITEMNPQHPDYVMFALAGYNGDFSGYTAALNARNAEFKRADGKPYVWTENIVPFRMYVGVKGKCEDGSKCDDILARNGLRYGKIYGFAIDMSGSGPSSGMWRDAFHLDPVKAMNGAKIPGKWIAQPWSWDGKVKNYQYDGSWDYQNDPAPGFKWWNSAGYDAGGAKTEHCTPDPRPGVTGFIQGSTAGYFGHLYVNDVLAQLSAGGLPAMFDGTYYVYQGELDITSQVKLGGKGQLAAGRNATRNWDSITGAGKATFEDIDGLEVFLASDGKLYAIIQEDSGSRTGERMLITSALEHEMDGKEITYYFIAQSGGSSNTRMAAKVGIPAGTSCGGGSHEFSGLFDMSGLLHKTGNSFTVSAADTGLAKNMANAMSSINEKTILVGLQSPNMACGVIKNFGADRGGQWLLYNPKIPL